MTRKHFIRLAAELERVKPCEDDSEKYLTWLKSCEAVAKACKIFNPSFDCRIFFKACGFLVFNRLIKIGE